MVDPDTLPDEVRPAPWPPRDDRIRQALESAWRNGSWGRYHGPFGETLIQKLCAFHNVPWVYLCASGTCGVELALRGVGVQADDRVVLAGYDYPGNFRAIEALGARPVLVDLQPGRWTIDLDQLQEVLRREKVRAIVVSHLHGELTAMAELCALAERFGAQVVEDACQAQGAWVDGRRAGAWGDAGVVSFGGSKLLTAGRGGAVLTRHERVWQRMKIFAERGNEAFPLSELQAAVLLPQLEQLDDRNAARHLQAITWKSVLEEEFGCQVASWTTDQKPSFYKLGVRPGRMAPDTFTRWLVAARSAGLPWGKGFRGFARRSARRSLQHFPLVHSQLAADQTVLVDHTQLAASPHAVMDFLLPRLQILLE